MGFFLCNFPAFNHRVVHLRKTGQAERSKSQAVRFFPGLGAGGDIVGWSHSPCCGKHFLGSHGAAHWVDDVDIPDVSFGLARPNCIAIPVSAAV